MWMSLSGTFSPVILMALKQRKNQVLGFAFPLLGSCISQFLLTCVHLHIFALNVKNLQDKIRFSKEQERRFNTKVAFPGISGGAPPAPYLLKIVSTNKPP